MTLFYCAAAFLAGAMIGAIVVCVLMAVKGGRGHGIR